jgi:hypothetical protein
MAEKGKGFGGVDGTRRPDVVEEGEREDGKEDGKEEE